eukprot:scaffold37301_cov67-Phaeocystis_antarctica.AAC.3
MTASSTHIYIVKPKARLEHGTGGAVGAPLSPSSFSRRGWPPSHRAYTSQASMASDTAHRGHRPPRLRCAQRPNPSASHCRLQRAPPRATSSRCACAPTDPSPPPASPPCAPSSAAATCLAFAPPRSSSPSASGLRSAPPPSSRHCCAPRRGRATPTGPTPRAARPPCVRTCTAGTSPASARPAPPTGTANRRPSARAPSSIRRCVCHHDWGSTRAPNSQAAPPRRGTSS